MKSRHFILISSLAAGVAVAAAVPEKQPEPPVPVVGGSPSTAAPGSAGRDYEQRLYGPGAATLVTPEKAQQVVDLFKSAYEKLGSPRFLIAINRELVDEAAGLQLKSRTEQVTANKQESKTDFTRDPNAPPPTPAPAPQTQVNVAIGGGTAGGGDTGFSAGKGQASATSEKVVAENKYEASDREKATLADKQTARDIERLVGRPLRASGVKLADQRVAAQLIADHPISHFTAPANDAARKDREALAKVADVVLEVLVSSRSVVASGVSGDTKQAVPDVQLTAIRLSDSAILGQASSTDVLGDDRNSARLARTYDVKSITEATALALMEDLAASVK